MGFREKTKGMKKGDKIKYFWDYYKWPTVITVFFVAVITMTLVECVNQVRPDVKIMFVAEINGQSYDNYVGDDHAMYISEELSPYIPDINGDGQQSAQVMAFMFEPEGQETQMTMALNAKLTAELALGEAYIMVMDEKWYDMLMMSEALAPVGDVLGYPTENEYYVPLGDTMLYSLESVEVLSGDMRVVTVLTTPRADAGDKDKEQFEIKAGIFRLLAGKP